MRGWIPTPRKTVLIIVDMHREFLEEGSPVETPRGRAMLPALSEFIRQLRAKDVKIIFTRHVHRRDKSDMGLMAELWPIVRDGTINAEGSLGTEIHSGLDVHEEDIVITKHRYSAFVGTDLEMVLRGLGIENVVIAGVLTNACCESTARDAMYKGFRVFFLSDLTATFDIPAYDGGSIPADTVQRVVCSTIASWFGEVLTANEFILRMPGDGV